MKILITYDLTIFVICFFILQEARAAGCRTSAEAGRYLEQKRRREAEENIRRVKESAQGGPSSQGAQNEFMASESVGKDANSRTAGQATSSSLNDFDIMGWPDAELLSETVSALFPFLVFSSPTILALLVTPLAILMNF